MTTLVSVIATLGGVEDTIDSGSVIIRRRMNHPFLMNSTQKSQSSWDEDWRVPLLAAESELSGLRVRSREDVSTPTIE
jgi:hypothetical protein